MHVEERKFQLICEILNEDDLPSIIKDLTAYAVSRFRFWKLLNESGVIGYSPEEIAIESINKVMLGEWNWNPEKELITYLKFEVIKGLVANLARKKEVQLSQDIGDAVHEYSRDTYTVVEELNAKQVLETIQKHIAGDEHVENVFLGLYEGYKRRDTIEEFGMTPAEYDSANKRLKTKLNELDGIGTFDSIKQ